MTKEKIKKKSTRTKNLATVQRRLRCIAYTPIAKPLNGSLPRSNNSHFLRLHPVTYIYKNGKEEKITTSETYLIKGIRGAIRHQVMITCYEAGLEVCHSSDKPADKTGKSLLPVGFHLLGACMENECIVHKIFGSKRHKSIISVHADPISSISHKSAKLEHNVQQVHIATENRISMSFDGRTIQNFSERYFSGEFIFELDVTCCNSIQLGLLIEAITNLEKLGRGYNSGYGHLKMKSLQLLERITNRSLVWKNHQFNVEDTITEKSLKDEVIQSLEDWYVYCDSERKNSHTNCHQKIRY
jgi:hypothetical protein